MLQSNLIRKRCDVTGTLIAVHIRRTFYGTVKSNRQSFVFSKRHAFGENLSVLFRHVSSLRNKFIPSYLPKRRIFSASVEIAWERADHICCFCLDTGLTDLRKVSLFYFKLVLLNLFVFVRPSVNPSKMHHFNVWESAKNVHKCSQETILENDAARRAKSNLVLISPPLPKRIYKQNNQQTSLDKSLSSTPQ